MSEQELDQVSAPFLSFELEPWLEGLRENVILFALPGLFLVGLVFLGNMEPFALQPWRTLLALTILLLVLIVWFLRKRNDLAAAWILVIGCLTVDLLVVSLGELDLAIWLLVVPVGLAVLTVGMRAGLIMAAVCTLGLLFVPATLLPVASMLRVIALIGIWGTGGMIWLTLYHLLQVVEWAWSGYEQNRISLERARDYQVQLYEMMEDLASANIQLTRLNRLAQALRQTAQEERRAKEQFVANVSHELRTPLNMIIGFCEMITESPEAYGENIPPVLLADLAVVLRNSQHLSSLVDDVLDLSQIEAGQMALTKERVSLAELVHSATVAIYPLFTSKGLYLETEVPDDLPLVFCDRTRIREVVLNLLSNAGRFTERGGVRVRVWRENGDVVASVADTGPGITEEGKNKLFQPFQQLDGSIRRRYGGTGLGLSISKSFVELHDGKMWIESEPGCGTTFFFRLPIDPLVPLDDNVLRWFSPFCAYEERPRPSRLQPSVLRPRLVVLENGNPLQRLLTRHLDGAEIVPVTGLEEAVEELARVPAQALLVNSSNMGDTLRLFTESVMLPYDIPTIICSIPGIEKTTGDLGVSDYLVKPVSREALLAALNRLENEVETVLVVDDELDALQLFRRMLSSVDHRYRVLRASDGRQALEILRQQRPDVVLLDLTMPEMDGFQFLDIKSQESDLNNIPVILISARDPLGQPIVSNALAVTCANGLSVQKLLDCIAALKAILSPMSPSGHPALKAMPSG